MSIFSKAIKKIGSGAKKLVTNPVKAVENIGRSVGKAARQAAPVVGLIPGVGTVYGATIGGLGSVLEGRKFSDSLKSAVTGGLSGYGNTKLLGGKGFKGLSGLASSIGGRLSPPGMPGIPGVPSVPGLPGSGGISGLLAAAKARGIGIGDILKGGIGLAGGVSGLVSSAKAGKAMDRSSGQQSGIADELATTGRAMNARAAPLADAAQQGLLARLARGPRATPDFSRFIDRANPFSGQFTPPPVAPMPAPAVAPVLPRPQLPDPRIPLRRRLKAPPVAYA